MISSVSNSHGNKFLLRGKLNRICMRRGLSIWLGKPSSLFPGGGKIVDGIFYPVRLDMERMRISFIVEQDQIVLFSMTWYQFILFYLAFYKIIYAHAISIQEFTSNIQILMHVVSLKVFNFIFPTYGFFSGMIHINQSMQMYIQQIIMVLCILYNGSLYVYNRLSNASLIIKIANKFILLLVFFL